MITMEKAISLPIQDVPVLILGLPKAGKSYLANKIIENSKARGINAILKEINYSGKGCRDRRYLELWKDMVNRMPDSGRWSYIIEGNMGYEFLAKGNGCYPIFSKLQQEMAKELNEELTFYPSVVLNIINGFPKHPEYPIQLRSTETKFPLTKSEIEVSMRYLQDYLLSPSEKSPIWIDVANEFGSISEAEVNILPITEGESFDNLILEAPNTIYAI